MRKRWDECPGVFCLGEVVKEYSSPARGSPCDEVGATRQGQTGYTSGTTSLQDVTTVGIGGYHKGMISPLLDKISPLQMVAIYNPRMVKFDPQKHHRRSIRLQGYDYASTGAYYVTIVAWHRECLFGEVVNKEMRLNRVGKIVEWEWLELPKRFSYIELSAYMVMPNHFHGILFIHENVGATRQGETISQSGAQPLPTIIPEGIDGSPLPRGPKPASLGAIMAQFKSRVTKRIWKFPEFKGTPVWQRNYYEHIIRNETDLQNKTDYIEANPLLWDEDDENPNNIHE